VVTRIAIGRTFAVLALVVLSAATADAKRTDVVILANGDRITGEIAALDRGQLEFKTDDAGTLYLEWDKLVSLLSIRQFEVVTAAGNRHVGSLGASSERSVTVITAEGPVILPMAEVTEIRPLGTSFWRRLDGSFDVGFSYTRSSGVAQLSLSSDTTFSRPAFEGRLTASLTQTRTKGEESDDRATLQLSYQRYPWLRWATFVAGGLERNQSLGLDLRSQVLAAIGPRLINSNRAQMVTGAGVAVNDERPIGGSASRNVEALLKFNYSFFTYDRPKTNLEFDLQYYSSLSERGRRRLQLDADVRRELWKDLFVQVRLYNTYDSRPPTVTANETDVGVMLSIGWTY
jgi:hypothetical protein